MTITYQFSDGKGLNESFSVDLDHPGPADDSALPEWTRLSYEQCRNCPLNASETERCPAAVSLVDLLPISEKVWSHDEVTVQVITPERTISQETTAQRAVSALMGMLLAASNCPMLAIFQPMVRFHLPFASRDETVYRVLSMYALAQFFHRQQGEELDVDFEALSDMYKEIQIVNRALASRLRSAATTDASTNAIAILDTFAQTIPFVIEDSLTDLEDLFEPYLKAVARMHEVRSKT